MKRSNLCAISKNHFSLKRIHESVPTLRECLGELPAGLHGDVEEPDRRVGEVFDGVYAVRVAGNHFDGNTVVVNGDLWNFCRPEVPVAGFAVFEILGEINPELETDVGGLL